MELQRNKASDYPQELLDLFDLYVHGDIDRRKFLDRAQKFAVGGVTAMALWESLRPNYAFAQQVPVDDMRLKTERVTVQSPNGNGTINGYYVRPAKITGKIPAILVIHENRGLNPYIEDVARRLGTNGYLAFAPDGLTSLGRYPGDERKSHGDVPQGGCSENVWGFSRFRHMAESSPGMFREIRSRWLLFRRQHGEQVGGSAAGPECGCFLLRRATECR